jgi:hypothetical protein
MTMPYAPAASAWVDLLTPSQCPCCGQAVMPSAQNYLDAFSTSMDALTSSVAQWMGAAGGTGPTAAGATVTGRPVPPQTGASGMPMYGWGRQQPAGPLTHRHGHHHQHGHQHHQGCGCGCHDQGGGCGCGRGPKNSGGCRQCGNDDCHCQCCVGDDLDLVVYSRVGERRVIPITLTNERRRERVVTLELSGFTSKGGRAVPVTGSIVGDATFTLAPCEERTVVVEVDSSAPTGDTANEPTDVDDCVVAVADLRVEGCDIRCPIGIGVVLLPRDCDTFDLSCGCGCC